MGVGGGGADHFAPIHRRQRQRITLIESFGMEMDIGESKPPPHGQNQNKQRPLAASQGDGLG